jgi:hypothetical protein
MNNDLSLLAKRLHSELLPVDREILTLIHDRVGHLPGAEMHLRGLQQQFANIDPEQFLRRCRFLVDVGYLLSRGDNAVSLSEEGSQAAVVLHSRPVPSVRLADTTVDFRPAVDDHLVWDVSRLRDPERALRFAQRFRQSLCVFSPVVEQLYTNYVLHYSRSPEPRLVVQPNLAIEEDTFNHITADALVPTGVFISAAADDSAQLHFRVGEGVEQVLALGAGLNFVDRKLWPSPLLPVLVNGDLRETPKGHPILHLHRLELGKITGRSAMEMKSLRLTIQDRLKEHFKYMPS